MATPGYQLSSLRMNCRPPTACVSGEASPDRKPGGAAWCWQL